VADPAAAERPRLGFVDTVEVNQVDLEVLVTDRKGRRILDLSRDDFEVLEDGRPVEITHFRAPGPPRGDGSAVEPGLEGASEPSTEPATGAAADGPSQHLLLFVDTLSLRLRDRRRLLETLQSSLSREPASLRLMLVTYDGRLRVRHGFDSPTAEVLASLAAIRTGRMASPGERGRQVAELADVAAELEAAEGADEYAQESARSRRDSARVELEAIAESERQEILRTLDVLRQLAFSLGGIAGRKSILYAGDDLTMLPASDLFAAAASAFGEESGSAGIGATAAERLDLYHDFKDLVRQANASGVSFYTLTPPSRQHLGDVAQGRVGSPSFQTSIRRDREDRIKEAVCLISHTTGGRCQAGGSDFSLLVDGALEDLDALYSLGYVPDRRPDGEFHRIQVRLKRRGLRVRHREGYVDRSPTDRLRERLSAALWLDAERDELRTQLTFGAQEALPARRRFLVPIEVAVPAEGFVPLPSSDPDVLVARGRILVMTAAANGRLTGSEEIQVSFELDAARRAAGAADVLTHRLELRLERGDQRVAIGVWDELGRRGSFLSRPVAVGAGVDVGR
jgi:VWFA-related protein